MKKLACCLLLSLIAAVQTVAAQTIAVKAGHLIDPAAGTVANNQTILIQDGKITAVGANVSVPAGAQVIDLSSEWVMPGMVDAHTHITMNVPPSPPGESLWPSYLLQESTGLRTARGIHNAEL